MFIKINPNFGQDLYNSGQPILFYIVILSAVIVLAVTLIKSAKGKFDVLKILEIFGIVISLSLVIFIAKDPKILLSMGDFVFNFLFDLLKSMEA